MLTKEKVCLLKAQRDENLEDLLEQIELRLDKQISQAILNGECSVQLLVTEKVSKDLVDRLLKSYSGTFPYLSFEWSTDKVDSVTKKNYLVTITGFILSDND